jgi:hypothetical protein
MPPLDTSKWKDIRLASAALHDAVSQKAPDHDTVQGAIDEAVRESRALGFLVDLPLKGDGGK